MQVEKLEDICEIASGGTPKRSEDSYWKNGKIPWLKISDIKSKYVDKSEEHITQKGLDNSSAKLFKKGTIIYTIFATVGEVAILNIDATTNQAIAGLTVKDSAQINPSYLFYFLKSIKKQMHLLSRGVAQNNINLSVLRQIKVPIPDLNVQERIVNALDQMQNNIKLRQMELSKLDILIKARFVEMFGDLKFDTPVSKYIESLTAGKSLAGKEKCTNKVLNTGAVSYDKFKNDYKYLPSNYVPDENNKVRTGNVLISRMNTQELVGATAYVWEAPENTYLPDRLWRANLKENVNSIFLWQVLIHPLLKLQIQRVSSGTSGSMKNISKSNFLKLKVPDVNEESQNKFASFVQQVDKSKVAIQKSLDETQTLFDSLMQKYFS
jgi:type I restriction enzyme S subunit